MSLPRYFQRVLWLCINYLVSLSSEHLPRYWYVSFALISFRNVHFFVRLFICLPMCLPLYLFVCITVRVCLSGLAAYRCVNALSLPLSFRLPRFPFRVLTFVMGRECHSGIRSAPRCPCCQPWKAGRRLRGEKYSELNLPFINARRPALRVAQDLVGPGPSLIFLTTPSFAAN